MLNESIRVNKGHRVNEVDWKSSVKRNTFYSKVLLILFILMCISFGILLDVIFNKLYFDISWGKAFTRIVTFERTPYLTYLYLFLCFTSLGFFLLFYNKFMLLGLNAVPVGSIPLQKEEAAPLAKGLSQMAKAVGLKSVPKIYISDSPVVNAFACGLREKKSVVLLTQGLIELLNARELQSIIAMQLCHIKCLDQRLTSVLAFMSNVNLVVFDLLTHSFLYGEERDREPNFLAHLFFKNLRIFRFLIPMLTFLYRFFLKSSRIIEAEKMTVKLMSDNTALAEALMKIYDHHFDNMEAMGEAYSEMACDEIRREAYVFDPADINKCQTFATPFTTHPSIEEQLEAIGYIK